MAAHFEAWRAPSVATLKALGPGCRPKEVIAELAESLLDHYRSRPLVDPYDIYQRLLDFWSETMQDDLYAIAAEGWKARPYRLIETDKKTGKQRDRGWACDLVPKELIVRRFFAAEQQAIDDLGAEIAATEAEVEALEEEHGGEEGVFGPFDKITKATAVARLREVEEESAARHGRSAGKEAELALVAEPAASYSAEGREGEPEVDEAEVLRTWLRLSAKKASLSKDLKTAEADLDRRVLATYPKLDEQQIQSLVVDDKWMATLDSAIRTEVDRIAQHLERRVRELAERYQTPLPALTKEVAELEGKVKRHLERMGFAWT
jgi:type I restriction enzyme M protein